MTKLLFPFFFISCVLSSKSQTATEVVKMADEKMRGSSSQAELVIKIVRPTWSREMKVKTWMSQSDFAMILIQSPVRDKGIVFLKRGKEVWNWMPTLERIIKLPPSMMSQSWMGTDFTNDDLVKESSVVKDYTHQFVGDTTIDGRNCHIIEFIPKPSTAVVWGKLLVSIDKKDLIELYTEFYDEEGQLINTMKADNIKMMDGRLIPTHIVMIPIDKQHQKTEITYASIQFNREIKAGFFSIENMKRVN